MTDSAAPGYYHASGDPPDTVRYWDGTQWTGETTQAPLPSTPAESADPLRFGGVGIRIAASVLDILVLIAVVTVFALIQGDIQDLEESEFLSEFWVVLVVVWVANLFMAAWLGGTPGKLVVGLRITTKDGTSTPPGIGPAFLRVLPSLINVVPVVGPYLGLGLIILNVVFVAKDTERRSVHDRVGGTRIVRKERLI